MVEKQSLSKMGDPTKDYNKKLANLDIMSMRSLNPNAINSRINTLNSSANKNSGG